MSAPEQIELKLRLERRLARDLLAYFREFLLAWQRTSGFMETTSWTRRLAQMFASHYAVVTRSVQMGRVVETGERLEDVVGPFEAGKLFDQAQDQAQRIMNRVVNDLVGDAVKATGQDMETKRKRFTTYLSVTLRAYWEKLKRRVGPIANINTQGVAEEAANPDGPPVMITEDPAEAEQIVKRWVTMLDERVRPHHMAAHGQIQPLNEPFVVNAELLRFPGDQTLGASLNNIINCRCSAEYGVMRDGEFVPFGVGTPRGQARDTTRPVPARPTSHFTLGASTRQMCGETSSWAMASVPRTSSEGAASTSMLAVKQSRQHQSCPAQ